jgi:hypothetical protein
MPQVTSIKGPHQAPNTPCSDNLIKENRPNNCKENETKVLQEAEKNIEECNRRMSIIKTKKTISNTTITSVGKILFSTKKPYENGPLVFQGRFIGPYIVVELLNKYSIQIALPSGL